MEALFIRSLSERDERTRGRMKGTWAHERRISLSFPHLTDFRTYLCSSPSPHERYDQMSTTIRDVAREAAVSVATVSRVFNGSKSVRPSTRERVLEAAHVLRYVPNETARSLIRSQTDTLGILLPDMHGEFFAQVMRGMEQAAQAFGYHVLVSSSHSDEQEARLMIRAMRGRVDGLVVMWPRAEVDVLAALVPEGVPVVLLNAPCEKCDVPVIAVDNYGGARAMTEHLLGHGHTRIALITGPEGNYEAAERRRGYRDALAAAGLPRDPSCELPGDFMRATGYRRADDVLALTPRPTALFAANDAMAIGALRRLRERGTSVPGELAVAGFDDIPTAHYMPPGLSTVRVPMRALGERAIDCLLSMVGERGGNGTCTPATQEVLPTTLVPRASCGCPPGDAAGEAPGEALGEAPAG